MNLYELVITIFILYLLYKFVYNILLPVSKATTTVRDQMRHMQEEQMRNQPQQKNTPTSAAGRNSSTTTDGEYIDFEEVK